MKRNFFIGLVEKLKKNKKEPWACFETTGVSAEGRVAFSISWNEAFIENLHKYGFIGQTDEESVQLFFLHSRMRPEELAGIPDDQGAIAEATPELTSEANTLRR
jgi:hypothetical protein